MSEQMELYGPNPIRPQPQASAVPYRMGAAGPEFCLITSRRSGRWAFPKGSIRQQDTVETAALSEALEEAGVTGNLVGDPLGQYTYSKRGETYSVTVMLMDVRHCSQVWKEGAQRQRCWVSYEYATALLDRPNLAELLDAAMHRLAQMPIDATEDLRLRA